ncbi:hypothetical protein BDZ89DRAFT_1055066 [Hymenopellis radicata]|nr:hypothetical protein BDZ89DRAFT_1055066 [Hymenopellis radicata]
MGSVLSKSKRLTCSLFDAADRQIWSGIGGLFAGQQNASERSILRDWRILDKAAEPMAHVFVSIKWSNMRSVFDAWFVEWPKKTHINALSTGEVPFQSKWHETVKGEGKSKLPPQAVPRRLLSGSTATEDCKRTGMKNGSSHYSGKEYAFKMRCTGLRAAQYRIPATTTAQLATPLAVPRSCKMIIPQINTERVRLRASLVNNLIWNRNIRFVQPAPVVPYDHQVPSMRDGGVMRQPPRRRHVTRASFLMSIVDIKNESTYPTISLRITSSVTALMSHFAFQVWRASCSASKGTARDGVHPAAQVRAEQEFEAQIAQDWTLEKPS